MALTPTLTLTQDDTSGGLCAYELEREDNMSVNKRRLYDLGLLPKFENSPLAETYEKLEEPFNSEQLQIGKEVAVLVDDDKQWVVGNITNMKVQGCIWATVPNANPKSRARPKQYVVCRIGSEERDYPISYCFVQEKIK